MELSAFFAPFPEFGMKQLSPITVHTFFKKNFVLKKHTKVNAKSLEKKYKNIKGRILDEPIYDHGFLF